MTITKELYTLLTDALECSIGYAESGKVPKGQTLKDLCGALAVAQAKQAL